MRIGRFWAGPSRAGGARYEVPSLQLAIHRQDGLRLRREAGFIGGLSRATGGFTEHVRGRLSAAFGPIEVVTVPRLVSRGACRACRVSVGVPQPVSVRTADGPQLAAYRLRTRASVERCLDPVVEDLVLEFDRSVAVAKAAQGSSPRQLHPARGLRIPGVSKIPCEVPDLGLQLLRQFPRCFDYFIEYLHVSPRVC
jgi:hypothetical protein